jgi:uncharacterized protein (DUF58 family)
VVLLLDRSQSSSFESAVSYTATLTKAVLKYGSQIGLVSVGEDRSVFALRSGEEQFTQIYYHLAKVQPNSKLSFAKVLGMEIGKFQPTVTFLFITGKLGKDTVESLEKISHRHIHLQVIITKDEGMKLTRDEHAYTELLKRRNIQVKVIYAGHTSETISEVS